SAFVATVIPWEKPRTCAAARPARSSAAWTAAITPSDWSCGVVGAFAVTIRPSNATTASVNVPPTSTPSSIRGGTLTRRGSRAPRSRGPRHPPQRTSGRERRLELLGLGEVLVRRAVAVVRQWHPLTGRALPGTRPALQRIPVDVEPVLRLPREELV